MRQKVISLLDRMPAAEAAYSNQSKKINMLLECELEQIWKQAYLGTSIKDESRRLQAT